jgi:hybrid polyketide synthase/nonribosomal peptide synthetase ACE1
MYTNSSSFPETSVRSAEPPTNGLYGYVASKWASEVYLERIHEHYGLPVFIHRPSSIICHEADMMGENPVPDVLQNLLAYSRHLRAVPAASGLRGTLDLVHPETVIQKAVHAVMKQKAKDGNNDGVVYLHESGDLELDIEELQAYLEKETNDKVEKVAVNNWIGRAERLGLSSAMAAVFKGLENAEGITFPKLLRK